MLFRSGKGVVLMGQATPTLPRHNNAEFRPRWIGLIIAYVFIIVYRCTIKLELKNIVVMIRYVYAVKHLLAIKINLLLKLILIKG